MNRTLKYVLIGALGLALGLGLGLALRADPYGPAPPAPPAKTVTVEQTEFVEHTTRIPGPERTVERTVPCTLPSTGGG